MCTKAQPFAPSLVSMELAQLFLVSGGTRTRTSLRDSHIARVDFSDPLADRPKVATASQILTIIGMLESHPPALRRIKLG
jgi:hypothetical protein